MKRRVGWEALREDRLDAATTERDAQLDPDRSQNLDVVDGGNVGMRVQPIGQEDQVDEERELEVPLQLLQLRRSLSATSQAGEAI